VSGFFLRVTPTELGIGVGAHGFDKDRLAAYRSGVIDPKAGAALVGATSAVEAAGWSLLGEKYKKTPRGFTPAIEQYVRDVKIDSLYEGTTGIQALDLFFRKIARDQGQTLSRLAADLLTFVKGGPDELAAERELLGEALEDVQAQIGVMGAHALASAEDPPQIYKTGLHANALLESLAELVIGWLLARHAAVALERLADGEDAAFHEGEDVPFYKGKDAAFYEGKVASARFFCRNVLPKARLRREAAQAEDGAVMALSDDAF